MAGLPANNARVLFGGYNISTALKSAMATRERETADAHTFADSDKESVPTLGAGMISAEGYWSGAANEIDVILNDAIGASAKKVGTFFPQGDTLGNRGYAINGDDSSHEYSGDVSGLIEVSAEIRSSVGLEAAVSLHALGQETATGNGTAVDGTAATTAGGAAYLTVTDVAGTSPTLDVLVQDSADGSTGWTTIATFTQVTADFQAQRVAIAGTIRRYTRATWTIGGSGSPSGTFQVAVSRK